ncbi:acyl-CoA dehydratase activase-related protein [uncultured Desulfobacter sp.]|uniref:acyl-CoA dehydratase activase-related protein n=1 Tax=uncultured Desulfobacter sp. TaxID=240139 RepID=UPI002AAAE9A6|nr:acyl-CoA dehydratase activase-related protein [uncultured Desulfobacter sp.]
MNSLKIYRAGLDIGSTTAKVVVLDDKGEPVFSNYQRHHAQVYKTVPAFFHQIENRFPGARLDLKLTGSVALGMADKTGLPFVQEVIAAHTLVKTQYPQVRTAIDIGGEDSKIIFFDPGRPLDIRMNGSCAGGTGSFIDQMATLLNITPSRLNELAAGYDHIYPVASRCGVFAKTDVQNMFSRNIPHTDIAASIFHAVAVQCINALARGRDICSEILLCGGVFTYLPELVNVFLRVLNISRDRLVMPSHAQLVPALGAALFDRYPAESKTTGELIALLEMHRDQPEKNPNRMAPLFDSYVHYSEWKKNLGLSQVVACPLSRYRGRVCFLGVDSGSTTTKIVVIGQEGQLLFSWYENNGGNPVQTVIKGLCLFRDAAANLDPGLKIARAAVTGYGEDLIRAGLNMDQGIVETLAHFTAARFVDPQVSFILDIGGQDMKAIFVENGAISRIEVNEACSSGCGSFLETLADSLNYGIEAFADLACRASAPCDLGTRCTVFMNSKIKQSLRENARIADISAGLSCSVIKNCLFKVLKLKTMSEMGDHIVLQGGTFKNLSIVRAMEQMTGKSVVTTQIPELMGALGAALSARQAWEELKMPATAFPGLTGLEQASRYTTRQMNCKGCENTCRITRFDFANGKTFFAGNKCEKHFFAEGEKRGQGFDFAAYKINALFNRPLAPHKTPLLTLGIPRVLNMYDNFVFWHALFTACGINVCLSGASTVKMSEKGLGTVMSDNICFPAKLVHGHIRDLADRQVDRIFFPMVIYEKKQFPKEMNTFNCPVVTGYPDVIQSAVSPLERFGIPLDRPVVAFNDEVLLEKACCRYLQGLGIPKKIGRRAFKKACMARDAFNAQMREKALEVIENAQKEKNLLIVLAGRPYHLDSLINQKLPEILTRLGTDIITEDVVPDDPQALDDVQVVTQWSYPNRIYNAARWVAGRRRHIQMVQINSFGCGPDAVVVDEVKEILKTGRKNHTLIKVDEISNPGSMRLRLRSMVESLEKESPCGRQDQEKEPLARIPFVRFGCSDRHRTILAPFFSEDYAPYIPGLFKGAGYDFKLLPPPDRKSVDLGLRYANNDICYPGIIVIGDVIKALRKEHYRPDRIAVGITQTGGQCRASNYLSLIRKALIGAGYEDIPIISVAAGGGSLVDQPGFSVNWLSRIRPLCICVMVVDCLARMYYATASREKSPGHSLKARHHYTKQLSGIMASLNSGQMISLLKKAVSDFNRIEVVRKNIPRMGIVGEIYAKYNYFGNQGLVNWLISQGIEPVLPPLVNFFIQDLVNYKENKRLGFRRKKAADLLAIPIEGMILAAQKQIRKIFSQFRFATPMDDIRDIALHASQILSLSNQFGEGWLIPGEIAGLARQKINHVISVQPFGCIANHIISKGVETRIKKEYPDMNLFHLDFDAGMSEANVRNRLHFMIEHL